MVSRTDDLDVKVLSNVKFYIIIIVYLVIADLLLVFGDYFDLISMSRTI